MKRPHPLVKASALPQDSPSPYSYWLCQIIGWTSAWLLKLFAELSEISPGPHPFYGFHWAIFLLSLFCFSHVYCLFIRRMNWRFLSWRQLLPRIVGASFLISVLNAPVALALILASPLDNSIFAGHFTIIITKALLLGFMIMMTWSAIYFGYHNQKRFQEVRFNHLRLRAALKEAEHRALSAQVNPHFLFNSLNTLRSLIEENPERARTAVTELALVFRASLQTTQKNLIPLREELETVHAYLSLERARHEDRLRIQEVIEDDALDALLPPFLLQTLIENAVKYGIAPNLEGGEVGYRAQIDARGLVLQVTNPGTINPASGSTGIGIENSRLRLRLLCGPQAILNLMCPQKDHVLAEVIIPQLGMAV